MPYIAVFFASIVEEKVLLGVKKNAKKGEGECQQDGSAAVVSQSCVVIDPSSQWSVWWSHRGASPPWYTQEDRDAVKDGRPDDGSDVEQNTNDSDSEFEDYA